MLYFDSMYAPLMLKYFKKKKENKCLKGGKTLKTLKAMILKSILALNRKKNKDRKKNVEGLRLYLSENVFFHFCLSQEFFEKSHYIKFLIVLL